MGGPRAQSIVLPENRAGQQDGDRRVNGHNLDLAWLPKFLGQASSPPLAASTPGSFQHCII